MLSQAISYEKLQANPENIFEIEQPETHKCVVERYRTGHSLMWITVYQGVERSLYNQPIHLVFSMIAYFEGPMTWIGANFRFAPIAEWRSLMEKLGWIQWMPEDSFDDYRKMYRLFMVQSIDPICRVYVLASNAYISDTAPSVFDE